MRLKFAKKYSEWNFNDWKNLIFSDESHFEVFNRKNRSYVRRLPSESDRPFNFQSRIQGGGGSVSVWGVMTAKGLGPLVFYDGRMNGENYISLMKSNLLPYVKKNFGPNDSWWYVQDNAPCHRSDLTMKWMKKHKINVMDCPAISPDLNFIENISDIIDKKLMKYHPTSVHDLQQIISRLWTEISTQTCTDLVQSMTRRIKKCIQVKGSTSAKY